MATVADYIRNILSSAKKLYITTTGPGPDADETTDSQLFWIYYKYNLDPTLECWYRYNLGPTIQVIEYIFI